MPVSLIPTTWPLWRLVKHQLWITAVLCGAVILVRALGVDVNSDVALILLVMLFAVMSRLGMPAIVSYTAALGPIIVSLFPQDLIFSGFIYAVVLLCGAIIVSSERIEMPLAQTFILLLLQSFFVGWLLF